MPGSDCYTGKWLKAGLISGGIAYRLTASERLIKGSDGSVSHGDPEELTWSTPSAGVFNYSESPESFDKRRARLKSTYKNGNGAGEPLTVQVKRDLWSTPMTNDAKNASLPPSMETWRHGTIYRETCGERQYLNPDWVETSIMGFPSGWTDLAA